MALSILAHLKATARALANATALDVSIVDGSGNQVTSFGGSGGTASNFGSAFPASGTAAGFKDSTGTNMAAGNLDASGNLKVAGTLSTTPPAAATVARTSVADSAVNQTMLASNASRLAFSIYNNSDKILFLKFGVTATSTDFDYSLLPQQDISTQTIGVNYTGRIDGIWEADSTGAARVVEYTA